MGIRSPGFSLSRNSNPQSRIPDPFGDGGIPATTATRPLNRNFLDHLLHDAFSDDRQTQAEVDLVLDPDPPQEHIHRVLSKYRFRDVRQAYRNLMSLGEERIRFLSTRRCRHFLAAIAPQLLAALAETADPDSTLVNLDKVSDSLGGKGILWELFSFNPPSLRLYVELFAHSPYLSGNPHEQSRA